MRAGPTDEGSAIVEVLALGVMLLVPMVYLVLVLGRVQAASFATEAAARDGARVVVSADDGDDVEARVVSVAGLAARDQGFAGDGQPEPTVTVACDARPCLRPGAVVEVTVRLEVVLPAVPAFVDAVVPARVPVQATSRAIVDRYRG